MGSSRQMEIEITQDIQLSPAQAAQLELHTFLNILNLAIAELTAIAALTPNPEDWRKLHERLGSLRVVMDEDHFSATVGLLLLETNHQLEGAITNAIVADNRLVNHKEFCERALNLRSVTTSLKTRTHEFVARHATPNSWVSYSTTALRDQLLRFFDATARNSRGRFRFAQPGQPRDADTYTLELRIEGAAPERVCMPPVLHDVFRDLLANARKYTPPGGSIAGRLRETPTEVEIEVEDTGRGIPGSELESVFQFGYRASNATEVRTYGGGFGLTKAYVVTKRLGGRLWVRSQPGHGTRFRIVIPKPPRA